MGVKSFIQILSEHSHVTWLSSVKRYICVLIAFALIGTVGPVSYHKGRERSWLFTSRSPIHRLHPLHGLIQKKYVLYEDDSTGKGTKKLFKQFSGRNIEFVVRSVNSYWLTIFDRVKHSPYIAFFAWLPLRSPPLF